MKWLCQSQVNNSDYLDHQSGGSWVYGDLWLMHLSMSTVGKGDTGRMTHVQVIIQHGKWFLSYKYA